MMNKYDGWTLKVITQRGKPYLFLRDVRQTRKEVIDNFELEMGGSWRKYRRTGPYSIVKIKLTEVED